MADTEGLEAKGPRGEACIIIRSWAAPAMQAAGDAADARGQPSYCLATGERLATTENPAVFETIDRSRRFTLRQR
jgi:hypothetical protein